MNEHKRTQRPAPRSALEARSPLHIEQYDFGWEVTFYGPDRHIKYVAEADSEIQAYRTAHQVAQMFNYQGEVYIRTVKREYLHDIASLMHNTRRE